MSSATKLISSITVLHELSEEKRLDIAREIYPVNAQIVDSVYGEQDVGHLAGLKATKCWFKDFRLPSGELVGYQLMYLFERQYKGKTIGIWEGNGGLLREYRGRDGMSQFGYRLFLAYRLRHPFRQMFIMFTTLQPASLMIVEKFLPSAYPYPTQSIAPKTRSMILDLADQLGLKRIPDKHEMVRFSPRVVKMTPQERAYWERSDKPAARFFLKMCPDYKDNEKLLTFVNFTFGVVFSAFYQVQKSAIKKFLRPKIGSVKRGAQKIKPASVKKKVLWLSTVPFFEQLSQVTKQKLAEKTKVQVLASQEMLFRQGDPGNGMYLIVQGTLSILLENDGIKYSVDKMTRGDIVGEMSTLTGAPRSASARAFLPLKLLWIPKAALLDLMAIYPDLHTSIWHTHSLRTGDNLLRFHPEYQEFDWEARMELLKAATLYEPASSTPFTGRTPTHLLLISGSATLDEVPISAPFLIPWNPNSTLVFHARSKYLKIQE